MLQAFVVFLCLSALRGFVISDHKLSVAPTFSWSELKINRPDGTKFNPKPENFETFKIQIPIDSKNKAKQFETFDVGDMVKMKEISLDDGELTSDDQEQTALKKGQEQAAKGASKDDPWKGSTESPQTRMGFLMAAAVSGLAAMAPEDSKQFAQSGADGICFLIAWFESGRTWKDYWQETKISYLAGLKGEELEQAKSRFKNGNRLAVLNLVGFSLFIVLAIIDAAETASDAAKGAAIVDPGLAVLASLKDVFTIIRFSLAMVLEIIKEAATTQNAAFDIGATLRSKLTTKFLGYVFWMLFKGITRFLVFVTTATAVTAACLVASWGLGNVACGLLGSVVGSLVSHILGYFYEGMELLYKNRKHVTAFLAKSFNKIHSLATVAAMGSRKLATRGTHNLWTWCEECFDAASNSFSEFDTYVDEFFD